MKLSTYVIVGVTGRLCEVKYTCIHTFVISVCL